MPRYEFQGRSAAEAAIKACEQLGMTRSELRYEVLSESGEGLSRRVVISVDSDAKPEPVSLATVGRDEAPERRERGDRDRDRGERRERRGDRDRDRGGRGGDRREARGRGGRDRDRDRDRGGRSDRDGRRREPEGAGIEPLLKLEQLPEGAQARPELGGERSARAVEGRTILNEVLRLMSYAASSCVVQDDEQEIHLDISGADASKIIGQAGEPLLSLQFLVNRMVSRENEGDQVIVLDVAGYRERRRAALADLARKLAARALEEKKVVKLSPMSAHDRRVFHLTLSDFQGVTTQSEGEGIYRRLLIIPAEFAPTA